MSHEEIARGQRAKEILESDLWIEAMERIDNSLLFKMEEHHSDPKACQEIALTRVIKTHFVSFFAEIRETGKMAVIQLERERELEARKEKLKRVPGA